ncbi:MAG: M48 family metallopeptidase [Alphaproteobacteria bacterium]|nr:M48 family metallopeptidase [Alphaproteobacteria bacterium]
MEQGILTLKNGTEVPFRVVRSASRRRSYALQVKEGVVEFRAPRWVGLAELLRFGQSRYRFIGNRLQEQARKAAQAAAKAQPKDWCALPPAWYQRAAKRLYPPRLAHYATVVGVTYSSLRITSGRSVWGSCTSTGAISLSWRLLLVPAALRDYVIIHELCHRKYMSHGPRFWALVGKFVPDYIEKRRALNRLGAEIG